MPFAQNVVLMAIAVEEAVVPIPNYFRRPVLHNAVGGDVGNPAGLKWMAGTVHREFCFVNVRHQRLLSSSKHIAV